MLINLSNHEFARWSEKQKQAAVQLYNDVRDFAFPAIDPKFDLRDVTTLVEKYLQNCREMLHSRTHENNAIHVMGEMTFVYQFVRRASAAGLRCVASTTERIAVDKPDGTKVSEFRFVRFREYEEGGADAK